MFTVGIFVELKADVYISVIKITGQAHAANGTTAQKQNENPEGKTVST